MPSDRGDGVALGSPTRGGTAEGLITIVQEDRFRLMDETGQGYLFTAPASAAAPEELERWCADRRRVAVRFHGIPDIGAEALDIEPV